MDHDARSHESLAARIGILAEVDSLRIGTAGQVAHRNDTQRAPEDILELLVTQRHHTFTWLEQSLDAKDVARLLHLLYQGIGVDGLTLSDAASSDPSR